MTEALATVSPVGKQASFASRARAEYLLVEKGSQQPRTLGSAFAKPVNDADLVAASVAEIDSFWHDMDKAYSSALRGRALYDEGWWGGDADRRDRLCDRRMNSMAEHLLFLLYAPLAAMGGVAVGERRGGFDRPGKSAILGLVAAALGIDRSNETAHMALADGYGFGLGQISSGRLLLDYHSAQTPQQRKGRLFATRKAELAVDELSTILSVREYRTDPAYLVVLWVRAAPRWTLGEFAEAMKRLQFALYFWAKGVPIGGAT